MQVKHTNRTQTGTLRITLNRVYTVVEETDTRYFIQNDAGSIQGYDKRLFTVTDTTPVNAGAVEAPTPTPRRGRPTNAEVAARTAAAMPQAPVETAAQRRTREAREEQERQEAARVAEERRRGRVLTEQDRITSITTSVTNEESNYNGHTDQGKIKLTIKYETKERSGDPSAMREKTAHVNVFKDNCFSCGIKTIVNIESFIDQVAMLPDYQQDDFEALKAAAINKALIAVVARAHQVYRTAMTICSVTNRNNYSDYLQTIGFTVSVAPVRNPNSSNHINLMVLMS